MIDGLGPYSATKDSELPWVGEVPEHWEMVPNRALVRRRKVLVGERHTQFQLLSLTKQGVVVRDLTNLTGKFSADMGTSQEVRPGDLVFCLFDVPETPRTVGLSNHQGMITGAYTVFEPLGRCLERFFELFYIAMDDRKLLGPLYSGLRNTIPPSVFLQVKTPLPPPAEQAAIVRFLDHTDRRIRRYIRTKQKLIALLEEQKQAIIHRAVTRGLDPNVHLKASGFDWLGEVPEHWDIVPTRYLFRQVARQDFNGDEPKMSMSRHLGLIRSEQLSSRAATAATSVAFNLCVPGDLVLNKYQAHNGQFGCAVERGLVTANYSVYAPSPQASAAYYALLYSSRPYRSEFLVACRGVGDGMMPLYQGAFARVPSLLPPLAEQAQIVERIGCETESMDRAIGRIRRELALLSEYRIRLVVDVVTGKLDVREAAARLPEDGVESEPLDAVDAEPDSDESADDLDTETEEATA